MVSSKHPIFETHILEGLCRSIGETDTGLSGTEIGQIIASRSLEN